MQFNRDQRKRLLIMWSRPERLPWFRLLTKESSGLELSGLSLTSRTTFATGGVAGESPPTSQRTRHDFSLFCSNVLICHIAQGNAGVHFQRIIVRLETRTEPQFHRIFQIKNEGPKCHAAACVILRAAGQRGR